MKNEILKKIINQIKKYKLTDSFSEIEQFKSWISKLNNTQINNFLSLDINIEEIINIRHIIINNNLLKCNDYKEKIYAISKLKNGEGCWHLYKNLGNPNFLNSKNFYKDIEMISKADTARYGLWAIGEDSFINSPYHDEDLKLIVETHDTNKEKKLDYIVSGALTTVAIDKDSIKSPFHRADMKLIATSGSDCLQSIGSYPEHSLNNLAVNEVSLKDKYHLENMQILSKNPIASEFLYTIMTDKDLIKSEHYRKEVEALINAKSKITARALYYYIVNPQRKYNLDSGFIDDYGFSNNHIFDTNSISGKKDKNYLNNLKLINETDDKFVMYLVSLLMSPSFINSSYKTFDLELLKNTTNSSIYYALYRLMLDKQSQESINHKKDAIIISQTKKENTRELLLEKALCEPSLNCENHEYDMQFISKLNLDSINENIYKEIEYYLFRIKGLNDPKHKEKLEKLLKGELVEKTNSINNYLNELEKEIKENKDKEIIKSTQDINSKPKSKILSLLKKER